jgi:uncharacterized protein (TIGR00730 family)
MKKICVFCGSSSGLGEKYITESRALGQSMGSQGLGLVYGGASIGVMGAVADGVLERGGNVWGVIPRSILDLEVGHQGLTELKIVDSMHERKKEMYDLSDAFIALPGGMGTLDELCEIITWGQLGYHKRPIYIVNQDGFFDHLLHHFRHINQLGFLKTEHLALFKEVPSGEEAISHFISQ